MRTLFLLLLILTAFSVCAQDMGALLATISMEENQAEELGKVQWLRDLDEAKTIAAKEDKPIFIFFQEVPGCHTCTNYGSQVMSHPLIVDAIEELFVPLVIYNNKGGKDAATLALYEEPSWNNPVVRIVDKNERALAKRLAGDYSLEGLVSTMIAALKRDKRAIPEYLRLLGQEWKAKAENAEEAIFAMYCFWTGETVLGALEGVIKTEAGFMGGQEVVRVLFDKDVLPFEELAKKAARQKCAASIYYTTEEQKEIANSALHNNQVREASKFRLDKEQKFYLSKTAYRFIPLTETQAARINSRLIKKENPKIILSPRQLALLNYYELRPDLGWKSLIGIPIEIAWENAMDKVRAWD